MKQTFSSSVIDDKSDSRFIIAIVINLPKRGKIHLLDLMADLDLFSLWNWFYGRLGNFKGIKRGVTFVSNPSTN